MKRFLFLTDTHFRSDRPKARLDDTYQAQFDELGEVAQLVLEHDVDAILHGGDFFNVRSPSHALVADLISWCKYVAIPIYVTIGNHDILGYNLDTVSNSGLGVLFESGAVTRLDERVFEEEKIVIRAAHSSATFKDEYMFPEKYNGYKKLIVSHNYVIPSETMPFDFVHPKDIASNADLVLCGHYHVPFDYTNGVTRWINPGALSRWAINERERHPTVLLITVDETVTVEAIPLKTAKPGELLFDVQGLLLDKQREADIKTFVDSLETTQFEKEDVELVVSEAGKANSIADPVLQKALAKIREAKVNLK